LRRVLERFPRLAVVVAHMGAPEYAEFLALAERYENVCLDTTMVFTDFFDVEAPYPRTLHERLLDLQPKVLLGSDFPTIPYPYAHQLTGLARLGLGEQWLRDVCWNNGVRIFGETRSVGAPVPRTVVPDHLRSSGFAGRAGRDQRWELKTQEGLI